MLGGLLHSRGHWALGLLITVVVAAPALAADDPLIAAARAGDVGGVRKLIGERADVNAQSADGSTPLLWAAYNGEPAMVEALLEAGAKPDTANRYGVTPLLQASRAGDAAVIATLLEHGANAALGHPDGETPLMGAARVGRIEAVELLLAAGVDVNAVDAFQHETALMRAAAEGHTVVVDRLLAAGADPNGQARVTALKDRKNADYPSGGFSALMWAVRNGHVDVVRRLVTAGADLNARNGDGATAMMIAIVNDRYDLAADARRPRRRRQRRLALPRRRDARRNDGLVRARRLEAARESPEPAHGARPDRTAARQGRRSQQAVRRPDALGDDVLRHRRQRLAVLPRRDRRRRRSAEATARARCGCRMDAEQRRRLERRQHQRRPDAVDGRNERRPWRAVLSRSRFRAQGTASVSRAVEPRAGAGREAVARGRCEPERRIADEGHGAAPRRGNAQPRDARCLDRGGRLAERKECRWAHAAAGCREAQARRSGESQPVRAAGVHAGRDARSRSSRCCARPPRRRRWLTRSQRGNEEEVALRGCRQCRGRGGGRRGRAPYAALAGCRAARALGDDRSLLRQLPQRCRAHGRCVVRAPEARERRGRCAHLGSRDPQAQARHDAAARGAAAGARRARVVRRRARVHARRCGRGSAVRGRADPCTG